MTQRISEIEKSERNENQKDKKVKEAILIQIKFHKNVLKSRGSRELFQGSAKGVKYSITELKENLRCILKLNHGADQEIEKESGLLYKPLNDMLTEIDAKKSEVFEKLSKTRQKVTVKNSQDNLSKFLKEPDMLVGKSVRHKLKVTSRTEWFDGVVDSVKERTEDVMKTEYTIRYLESDEEVWFFSLLVDLKNGDLILQ